MNRQIAYMRVQVLVNKSLTYRLHGKAAELAVLTEIEVYRYNGKEKPKNLRSLPCLMAEASKCYHR